MQQQIEQIGQDEDGAKGLEHICFAPVVEVGANATLSQCTVQSIFGYFSNSITEFQKSDTSENGYQINYLNKLDICFT